MKNGHVFRAEGTLSTEVAGTTVVVVPRKLASYTLSEVGAVVWGLADGRRLSEIVSAVASQYAADPRTIEQDVVAFVDDLVEKGALENKA